MFARSFIRLAAKDRADVHPALKKWWKKFHHVDGEVTRTLSPHEQDFVSSLFTGLPQKLSKYFVKYALSIGPGFVTIFGIYTWANWKHKEIAYHHRS